MNEQLFLEKISELTETPLSELSLGTRVADLSIWDSMAAAAFLAFAAEQGGDGLVGGIQGAKTVGDLYSLAHGAGHACEH